MESVIKVTKFRTILIKWKMTIHDYKNYSF